MNRITFLLLLMIASLGANAKITMPKLFGDNMVLQRNKPIKVWGWAASNEKIEVQFRQQIKKLKAGKDGKWLVELDPEQAGGPFQLIIKGSNTLEYNNVLIGEVWLCSGQSNMEMPIAGWGKINNYQKEIKDADYPQIRQFEVPKVTSGELKESLSGGDWKVCSPSTAGAFSATAYFFARALYVKLKVPIGLINSTWGGTNSETWTSQQAMEQSEEFKAIANQVKSGNMEFLNQQRNAARLKKLEQTVGVIHHSADAVHYKDENYNDSKWGSLKVPGFWEEQGFPDLDGWVWFRKSITISDADAGKPGILELAKIDDRDETYVNGIKVGNSESWIDDRKYAIPAGLLKAGINTIAVRVQDDGGEGGINGDPAHVMLTTNQKSYPLAGDWKYKIDSVFLPSAAIGPNDYPSLLFNAMIQPLIPYTIEGVIWYQGESNADRAYQYRKAFPLMITDWRNHWKDSTLPFYFVQLSSFGSANDNSNSGSKWAELREAQTQTLSLPNTGMIVTTDIGNPTDIHPKNKQEVGKRLASLALHQLYHQEGEYTGPVYQSMKIEGNKIFLSFTHTGNGWFVKDKYGYIKGFEIAGEDQKFQFAKAIIEGDKIVVFQDSIEHPVAVRYNWADDASEGNLFNNSYYPVAPFRTDPWKSITADKKYTVQ